MRRGFSRKTAADTERGKKRMRPCTGALIGGIIYSRTKEESCPAKPAARSFPYSTRRQQPARENHTDAKEPPFFCVGFFHRPCLRCTKGNGCSPPSGSPKSKSVGLFRCADSFPRLLQQKAALSRRKRRLSAGQINKIISRAQRPAFRSNSSSCWPVARSQAVNTPFSYSI